MQTSGYIKKLNIGLMSFSAELAEPISWDLVSFKHLFSEFFHLLVNRPDIGKIHNLGDPEKSDELRHPSGVTPLRFLFHGDYLAAVWYVGYVSGTQSERLYGSLADLVKLLRRSGKEVFHTVVSP